MRAIVPNSREQRKAALRRQDVAGLRPGVLCPFRFELLGRGNVWSYPTFPPSLRVSYLIQIPKAIRLKVDECRALPSPPPPSACAVRRAYKTPARPRWGLCFLSVGRVCALNGPKGRQVTRGLYHPICICLDLRGRRTVAVCGVGVPGPTDLHSLP